MGSTKGNLWLCFKLCQHFHFYMHFWRSELVLIRRCAWNEWIYVSNIYASHFKRWKFSRSRSEEMFSKLLNNKGLERTGDHCQKWIFPGKYFLILLSCLNKILMLRGARFWTKTKQKKPLSPHGHVCMFCPNSKIVNPNSFLKYFKNQANNILF